MKTKLFLPSAFIIILFSSSWFLPLNSIELKSKKYLILSDSIPENLKQVFENSCTGCHAPGGSTLAMSKLNFSEWDGYSEKKQAAKASKIYEELSEGKMPPKKARKEHPELIPTQEQIESIRVWSETLNSEVEYSNK